TAFADVLQVEQPIHFTGDGIESVADAPVYAVTSDRLGDVINRPDVEHNVAQFRGGVAVLLENMNPPATVAHIADRINRMQLQPGFEQAPYRPAYVIGLTPAGVDAKTGEPLYSAAVALAADDQINY